MKLLDKFSFRVASVPGFTHSCKRNAVGDYEVKWARGYAEHLGMIPRKCFDERDVRGIVERNGWIVVDEIEKVDVFPQEFYLRVPRGSVYGFSKIDSDNWLCFNPKDSGRDTSPWHADEILDNINRGVWKLCDKPKPLTAEQQCAVKEYKEQLLALDSSIKINRQTIAHHERLISNYEARQEDVKAKIKEIEESV